MRSSLAIAARNLEQRFQLLNIPTRSIPPDAWLYLNPDVHAKIPAWLKDLHANFSLVGGVLEARHRPNPYPLLFGFLDIPDLQRVLAPDSLFQPLLTHNHLPFASESDGSLWLTHLHDTHEPIYLLDLSAWDGQTPSKHNGLHLAFPRLEELLLTMAITTDP